MVRSSAAGRARPARPVKRPPTTRGARPTSPSTGAAIGHALQSVWRFSRPRSASQTLVLIFAFLGLISILAGLYSDINGKSQAALYWGVILLFGAVIARARIIWQRWEHSFSLREARVVVGVTLLFCVLVVVTGIIIARAVGSDIIPLLGPLSTPWVAYPVLSIALLAGLAALAGSEKVVRMVRFPAGLAIQVHLPSATKVTRHTRIDRENGSMLDVGEPETVDLMSTPILSSKERKRKPSTTEEERSLVVRPLGDRETQSLLPPPQILNPAGAAAAAPLDLDAKARTIEQKLATFGVGAKVVGYHRGPTVTLFDVDPDPGVKVKRITELQNDLALALAAPTVRIQAPVPGRPVVGIEIPNTISTTVTMREVLESDSFHGIDSALRVAVGKGVGGEAVSIDLAAMPHLLIAGATGSGKSVMLNVLISSLLFQNTPDDVRMLMIDPKMVELTVYNGIPHLYSPVVTEMDKVLGVLRWTIREMERRYALFRDASARNLTRYNQHLVQRGQRKLPYIVAVVDELADLMMVAPDEVEDCICRLAQLARATGIHLVIATQRPSVDVVTGLIKANFPARMAFAMSSQVDSRTILDQVGAEKLLGRGDMLYQSPSAPKPVRLQAALISDAEIERLVEFWQRAPLQLEQVSADEFVRQASEDPEHTDALFESAKTIVREHKRASVSLLQRKLSVGYQRAARLMDLLEQEGIVTAGEGGRYRAVSENDEADDSLP